MSHYTKIKTQLNDLSCLREALKDLGFLEKDIQCHDKATQLEGYQGDKRADLAEVIIPRRAIGGISNDIGFKLQEDGTYGAIISDYDKTSGVPRKNERTKSLKGGYGEDWLGLLNQRYAYHKLKKQVQEQGYFIESEREVNGEVELTISTYG